MYSTYRAYPNSKKFQKSLRKRRVQKSLEQIVSKRVSSIIGPAGGHSYRIHSKLRAPWHWTENLKKH